MSELMADLPAGGESVEKLQRMKNVLEVNNRALQVCRPREPARYTSRARGTGEPLTRLPNARCLPCTRSHK